MKELTNLFKDKNFIAFILVAFIFYILFYEHLDYEIKKQIYKTLTNPIYIILIIGLIGLVLHYNFTIGIILALTLVISLTFREHNNNNNNQKKNNNQNIIRQKLKNRKKIEEGFQNKSKKSFIEKTLNKMVNSLEDGIKENKKLEQSLSKIDNDEYDDYSNDSDDNDHSDDNNRDTKNKSKNIKRGKTKTKKKENFGSLEISRRKFDLTNKDDKILVYTKEVLKDIINRIEYEYDDRDYLKKYIGSKFEEIIDLLGLLNDD